MFIPLAPICFYRSGILLYMYTRATGFTRTRTVGLRLKVQVRRHWSISTCNDRQLRIGLVGIAVFELAWEAGEGHVLLKVGEGEYAYDAFGQVWKVVKFGAKTKLQLVTWIWIFIRCSQTRLETLCSQQNVLVDRHKRLSFRCDIAKSCTPLWLIANSNTFCPSWICYFCWYSAGRTVSSLCPCFILSTIQPVHSRSRMEPTSLANSCTLLQWGNRAFRIWPFTWDMPNNGLMFGQGAGW